MRERTMSFPSWLHSFRPVLAPSQRHRRRRGASESPMHQPSFEVLEDRRLLSFSGGSIPEDLDAHVVWAPQPPLLADFTGDGIPDKISSTWREVDVRPGRGDGIFGGAIRTLPPSDWTWAVAGGLMVVADFNA